MLVRRPVQWSRSVPVLVAALTVAAVVAALVASGATTRVVDGTATWPGERLQKALLTKADFPAGVGFNRLHDTPDAAGGAANAPSMLTRPEGCSNGLTNVIAASGERGPGSAEKYEVIYDGARIMMTVLSWHLDLAALEATASRCEHFVVLFDAADAGIPMTTTALPHSHPQELMYKQTMALGQDAADVYMGVANIGSLSLFGVVFPTPNPNVNVKAELPQTFLTVFAKQSERLRAV